MGSYVGIDLHRRRSVVVVLNEDGKRVSWSRIDNTPANLAAEIVAAGGPAAEVAMEATWGWYWAADVPSFGRSVRCGTARTLEPLDSVGRGCQRKATPVHLPPNPNSRSAMLTGPGYEITIPLCVKGQVRSVVRARGAGPVAVAFGSA